MSIVKRIRVKDFQNSDTGIHLKEAFKLVENFELKEELINQFDIDLNQNIFFNIKGAATLVEAVLNLENRIDKFDIDTKIKDIHISKFKDKNQIEIDVFNISNSTVLKNYKSNTISAISAYSVRNDLLDGLYRADKFLSHLNNQGYDSLIRTTIEQLEELNGKNSDTKKLRYVEGEDGKLYVRAITSTNLYKDYNIAFSVFIVLYQLNRLNSSGYKFEVEQFNFDESEISVLFKEINKNININEKVSISFALELTNSEIKSKAVKLNGNFIIQTQDFSVYTKNNINTTVLSIGHGYTIKKAKEYIQSLPDNIDVYIMNSIENYKNIGKIQKFEDIQKYLSIKLQNSNIPEIKKYNLEFQKELKGRIKSLLDLLEKMHKLESLIKDEDIIALEFLREKIYQSIVEKGKS